MLDSIQPKEVDGQLVSTQLQERLHGKESEDEKEREPGFLEFEHQLWERFLAAEVDSVEELRIGQQIAEINHLKTSEQQQFEGRDRSLWAERYTQSSEALYGEIESGLAETTLFEQVSSALALESDDLRVVTAQKRIKELFGEGVDQPQADREKAEADEAEIHEKSRSALMEILAPVHEVLTGLAEGSYSPAEAREVFRDIIQLFGQTSPEWRAWAVTNKIDKAQLSVDAKTRSIDVPDGRPPIESLMDLLGKAMHEAGIHAYRGAQGYEAGDENLAIGLPGYMDFEEGLGIYVEYLFTGQEPVRAKDRYVDIALATGAMGSGPMDRQTLLQFVIDRQTIRDSHEGKEIDLNKIEEAAKIHVNRIFRGGDGQIHETIDGQEVQAVMVKDMVYYSGFLSAKAYIEKEIRDGRDPTEMWNYLLQGKFSPLIPVHAAYVAEKAKLAA